MSGDVELPSGTSPDNTNVFASINLLYIANDKATSYFLVRQLYITAKMALNRVSDVKEVNVSGEALLSHPFATAKTVEASRGRLLAILVVQLRLIPPGTVSVKSLLGNAVSRTASLAGIRTQSSSIEPLRLSLPVFKRVARLSITDSSASSTDLARCKIAPILRSLDKRSEGIGAKVDGQEFSNADVPLELPLRDGSLTWLSFGSRDVGSERCCSFGKLTAALSDARLESSSVRDVRLRIQFAHSTDFPAPPNPVA
ncbi:hypothetical protein KC341_g43 [Hortaea werneckii]|nr:hypothetical protein KC341_g43 [Hortaea werneckii]